jgi:prepilin-type processing-associated H-X9-DG protein
MPEPLLPVDRHNGKAHFLFADGHVGALKMEEIREKNIFWNY